MKKSPTPEQIKKLLKKHKISQAEAAIFCGLSKPTMEKWCQGVHIMPYLSWVGLKSVLGSKVSTS
jgi:DNA-binding transcriptional regulator YiaG